MNQATTLLSITEIFKDRFFKIPDYQRGYSWEKDQLIDLKDDIKNLYNRDYRHFTGTIVAAHDSKNNQLSIVDGQQRLTSILILLKAIYKSDPIEFSEIPLLFLRRGKIGEEISVLEPNEETRLFFTDLIYNDLTPIAKIKSHSNIQYAFDFFKVWVKQDNAALIYNTIINKLGFILFTPKDDKEIGIMFEVINNRGKRLSELEKIKNYFIYYATIKGKNTLRQTINDKWKAIQENLSRSGKTTNDDENSFLRYTYLVFYEPSKANSSHVYDELKERYSPIEKNTIKIEEQIAEMKNYVEFLANASSYYTYLFVENEFINDRKKTDAIKSINNILTYLRCHPVNASIMPLYLAIINNFNQPLPPDLNEKERETRISDLLLLLEKVNFRLYLLPGIFRRTDSKQADLFTYANEFYCYPEWTSVDEPPYSAQHNDNKIIKGNIFDAIEIELIELVKSFCPITKFVEALTLDRGENYDYYNWRDSGLRYFLARYEEELKRKARLQFDFSRFLKKREDVKDTPNEYLSVEHIWAQENRNPPFPPNNKEKRRLGNFVLMGMIANIKQSKDDIPIKVNKLVDENEVGKGSLDMHQIAELRMLMNKVLETERMESRKNKTSNYYHDLSMIMNDIRETILIKFALKTWKIKGENTSDFIEVDSIKAWENNSVNNFHLKSNE